MWVAQFFGFDRPNRWITSGGLGTMGFGLPAALGAQLANPGRLVIDIAGDASVQTTMKELSTAIQHQAPIKIFVLSDEHPGMPSGSLGMGDDPQASYDVYAIPSGTEAPYVFKEVRPRKG